jgi:hypothetical protein
MTYYLSGPMSGYADSNFPAFEKAAHELRAAGLTIVSPHEKGSETADANYLDLLREDVRMICDCQAMILLPGWPTSSGSRLELAVALGLKMDVYFYGAFGLVRMSKAPGSTEVS